LAGLQAKIAGISDSDLPHQREVKEGKHVLNLTHLSCRHFNGNKCGYSCLCSLQPWQPPALVGAADGGEALDAGDDAGQACEDRSGECLSRSVRLFQLAEVAVPRDLFTQMLNRINGLGVPPPLAVSDRMIQQW
jgi:hypothetical protein